MESQLQQEFRQGLGQEQTLTMTFNMPNIGMEVVTNKVTQAIIQQLLYCPLKFHLPWLAIKWKC